MVDEVHTRLVVDTDFQRLHQATNEIRRAVEVSNAAAARSGQSPQAMAQSVELLRRRHEVEKRSGLEIVEILKRKNLSEKDYLTMVRSNIDAERQAAAAVSVHSNSLTGLIAQYTTVGAVVAATSKAFFSFANQAERMRVIKARTNETNEAIANLQKTIEQTSADIGMMNEEVADAFMALRESGRYTIDQIAKIGPAVATEAKRMGISSREFASTIGQIMANMNIVPERVQEVVNIISGSLVRGKVNASEFNNVAGMIAATLDELGQTGLPGLARGMAMWEQTTTGAFGNAQRASRTWQQSMNQIQTGGGVAGALGFTDRQWAKTIEGIEKNGGDVIDFYIKMIEEALARGETMATLFPVQQQRRFWETQMRNMDHTRQRQREIIEDSKRGGKAIEEGPAQAWEKVKVAADRAWQSIGGLIDKLGASRTLKEFADLLHIAASALEKIREFSDWMDTKTPKGFEPENIIGNMVSGMTRSVLDPKSFADIMIRGMTPNPLGKPITTVPIAPQNTPQGPTIAPGAPFTPTPEKSWWQRFRGALPMSDRIEESQDTHLTQIRDILYRMEQGGGGGGVTTLGGGRHRLTMEGGGGTSVTPASLPGGGGGLGPSAGTTPPSGAPPTGGEGASISALADAVQKQEGFFPGSRSHRNNNPGNLKFGPRARKFGATGADSRGFAIFPSYDAGRAAMVDLLKSHSGKSLEQIGRSYAEGDPAWSRNIARSLGISPTQPINLGEGGGGISSGQKPGEFAFPVQGGRVISQYGASRDGGRRTHKGIDIGSRSGTPITATTGKQRVVRAGIIGKNYGYGVITRDEQGREHVYAHMLTDPTKTHGIRAGQVLDQGQPIGSVGQSGNARGTAPHLHYEVRPRPGAYNQAYDPRQFLFPGGQQVAGPQAQPTRTAAMGAAQAAGIDPSSGVALPVPTDDQMWGAINRARGINPALIPQREAIGVARPSLRRPTQTEPNALQRWLARHGIGQLPSAGKTGANDLQRMMDLRTELEQPLHVPVMVNSVGVQYVRPGIDRTWKNRVAREESWNANYDIGVA